MGNPIIAKAIKEQYPDINWDRFEDIDRAVNFDLWYGTAHEYFGEDKAEELEHYEWKGYEQGCKDLVEVLEPLPEGLWYDKDAEFLMTERYDPETDDNNWIINCEHCDERIYNEKTEKGQDNWQTMEVSDNGCEHEPDHDSLVWIGEGWTEINLRKELMFTETYKHVF